MEPIIIFGNTELTKMVIDIIHQNKNVVYGILDDDEYLHGTEIMNIPVLSDTENEKYLNLINEKCSPFVAFEDTISRIKFTKNLLKKYNVTPSNIIHPTAIISEYAKLGYGNLIGPGVFIGPEVEIGNHTLIKSNSNIESGVKVCNFVSIGSGCNICSKVKIEEAAFLGAGVSVINNINIGNHSVIGIGSTVINNIKTEESVFGNPAKVI